jgi:hypothetical protein
MHDGSFVCGPLAAVLSKPFEALDVGAAIQLALGSTRRKTSTAKKRKRTKRTAG